MNSAITGCVATIATRKRHAGHALHRFSEVRVGEFADVFSNDRIDRCRFTAFHAERAVERGAEASDDDIGGFGLIGDGLILGDGGNRHEQRGGDRDGRAAARKCETGVQHDFLPY